MDIVHIVLDLIKVHRFIYQMIKNLGKFVIIFGVDNSSLVKVNNRKKIN